MHWPTHHAVVNSLPAMVRQSSPEALLVIDTQASMVKLPLMSSDGLSGTLIQPLTGPESTYQASNGCARAAVVPSSASAAKATNDRARRAARNGWRDMGAPLSM